MATQTRLQDAGQAVALGPGVEAHRRAHGAGDAGQKLEAGKTQPGRGLGQPGQSYAGPGPQGVAAALEALEASGQMQGEPRQPGVVDEDVGAPPQEEERPAPVLGQTHQTPDVLQVRGRGQPRRRPADPPGGQGRQGMVF